MLAVTALAALPAAALALSFGEPEDLPTNGNPVVGSLFLGAPADESVVAVWHDHQPGPTQVKASVRPPGGGFGAAQVLSPDGVYAELLYMDVGPQGHAVAFWREEGNTRQIRFAARAPGGAFGPAADMPLPPGYEGGARFDVGSNGVAVVIYPTFDDTEETLLSSMRDPVTGNWGALQQVTSVPRSGSPRLQPCAVKLAPSGDALALYRSREGTETHVRAKYRPAGGAWVNQQSLAPERRATTARSPIAGSTSTPPGASRPWCSPPTTTPSARSAPRARPAPGPRP